jgi:peptide/nickel transport system permease protein
MASDVVQTTTAVDPAKVNPAATTETPHIALASQWRLMWWRFRKHRLAMISLVIILTFYFIAVFADFFAPQSKSTYHRYYTQAPPQQIHWFDDGDFGPYVYGQKQKTDPITYQRSYTDDTETKIPLGFFVEGDEYTLGLSGTPFHITANRHLFGSKTPGEPFHIFGADDMGRDVWSRLIFASQISLSVGLVGVFLSLTLGLILGGLSGLVGGWVDNLIQRLIEILKSIPDIPLWMALATTVPARWDPVVVYFMITVILSLLGWTQMARVVRGRFLALREEDFILAAELDGVPRLRIITRHMIPSFLSHIIASVTLAIPGMILGETALSFLSLGLRRPVVSWGVMLNEAQSIRVISNMPWMLLPGAAVMITVLVFNFLGDGLRDAADPYH